MGCGQSKINLYPRRNKSSGKAQNGKKSGAADSKDGGVDDENGSSGDTLEAKETEVQHKDKEDLCLKIQKDKPKTPLPIHSLGHAAAVAEISASQQEFFKMLDAMIDSGRDYDSSSETEIQIEQARISSLLTQWESASQSSSQYNHSSPPTPSRHRQNSQERQSSIQYNPCDQPRSPDLRRCLKGPPIRPQTQSISPASPPSRRAHSSPHSYQPNQEYSDKQLTDSPKQVYDNSSSPPTKRAQSAGVSWKVNPKSATYNPKSGQKIEAFDDQRCYSPNLLSQREIHQSYGVSQDYIDTSRDTSQITYNPTFQSHSPAHSSSKGANPQAFNPQPYIAQIITYPMSQQAVSFHNASKYISQPPTYQQQPGTSTVQRYPTRAQIGANQPPSNIYYIAPTAMVPQQIPDQILTPKQQTALHLQQYVAMKQAQQALGYNQRIVSGQSMQDFTQYSTSPSESSANYSRKMYDDSYALNYMTVGRQVTQKIPMATQPVRQTTPSIVQLQQNVSQSINLQQYNPLVQRAQSVQNIQTFQNRPGCTASLGRNQSLSQKDMITADRYGISNTASNSNSPQNNVSVRNNMCQSLNIMTQKTVGQIVPVAGQDLVIYQNLGDGDNRKRLAEPNIALGSTDSVVSNKGLLLNEGKQGREQFFTVPGGEQCQIVNQTVTEQKTIAKQHLGSNIVGRQMYYSQVVTGSDQKGASAHPITGNDISAKKTASDSSLKNSRPANSKNSLDNTSAGGYL